LYENIKIGRSQEKLKAGVITERQYNIIAEQSEREDRDIG